MRLLLAEDEKDLSKALCAMLKHNNYSVDAVYNGQDALDYGLCENYDGIILDLMMPKRDGIEVLQELRRQGISTPVLILTAKTDVEDRITGLDAGADDYLTKPFDEIELIYRIKALLRRANIANEQKLEIGNVLLDYDALTVTRDGESQTLPKKEFYLLFKLLSNPNKIFTRLQLMDEIWGMNSTTVDTTVNVHINRLRKRFGEYPEFTIVAIKGLGYKAVIN